MSRHARPGGLTALAVLNFIFAGLAILGLISTFFLVGMLYMMENNPDFRKKMDEDKNLQHQLKELPGVGILILIAALNLVSGVLLLLSGIGYLKLKRTLGYILGNISALFSLSVFGLVMCTWPDSFGLLSLRDILYPLLTLFLLNFTFRQDFVN